MLIRPDHSRVPPEEYVVISQVLSPLQYNAAVTDISQIATSPSVSNPSAASLRLTPLHSSTGGGRRLDFQRSALNDVRVAGGCPQLDQQTRAAVMAGIAGKVRASKA